jgi:hypothetical protein
VGTGLPQKMRQILIGAHAHRKTAAQFCGMRAPRKLHALQPIRIG